MLWAVYVQSEIPSPALIELHLRVNKETTDGCCKYAAVDQRKEETTMQLMWKNSERYKTLQWLKKLNANLSLIIFCCRFLISNYS